MSRSPRASDVKDAMIVKTPFGRGVRMIGTTYIDYNEVLSYINRELGKGVRSRDAILTNLQKVLNTMHS